MAFAKETLERLHLWHREPSQSPPSGFGSLEGESDHVYGAPSLSGVAAAVTGEMASANLTRPTQYEGYWRDFSDSSNHQH